MLSLDRFNRLDKLGIIWNHLDQRWEEGFLALKFYKEEQGNCLVHISYKTICGFTLGSWVSTQRRTKETLKTDRIDRLDQLGFVWNPFEKQWENSLDELIRFKEENGHFQVPKSYTTGSGISLGVWAMTQRRTKKTLNPDRAKRLDDLGFDWEIK